MTNPSERPFDHLVFDLDDTLLDTYRQLIPPAARESCEAMVEAGLATDVETCLSIRAELVKSRRRHDLYRQLIERFGVKEGARPDVVAQIGYDAFRNREVETDITLFPAARDLLRDLRGRYGLHLVTAGHRATQESKIRILGIAPEFDSISHVDPLKGERKQFAFERIMRSSARSPHRYLSIGNRLDSDIADAKTIGWMTCWVRYGEYAHMIPTNEHERPDFEIHELQELMTTCRL